MARPIWCRLLLHWMRAAASRTFWTAGNSRPMRMAMIAITTSNSISVNAEDLFRDRGRGMGASLSAGSGKRGLLRLTHSVRNRAPIESGSSQMLAAEARERYYRQAGLLAYGSC